MNQRPLAILVTGASGFIGRHVVHHLAEAGHRVTALDFRPPAERHPESVEVIWCDIRSGSPPKRTFDAVVHLAALAGVRPSMDRPLEYETTNVLGTIRLLEFCRRMAVPVFVLASSSSVYGPGNPLPAVESDHPMPAGPEILRIADRSAAPRQVARSARMAGTDLRNGPAGDGQIEWGSCRALQSAIETPAADQEIRATDRATGLSNPQSAIRNRQSPGRRARNAREP